MKGKKYYYKDGEKLITAANSAEIVVMVILFALTMVLLGGKAMAYTVTPSSVTFGWTAPGDDGTTGQAASYDIRYSTSMITDQNWSGAAQAAGEPAPNFAGLQETFTVAGLSPAQTYYFALKTVDESGNFSEMSNVFSATTSLTLDDEDDVTIASPANGEVIHNSQPVLAVMNVDSQSSNFYHFEVATDSGFVGLIDASTAVPQQEGSETSWQVTEKLVAGVAYYWRAIANGTDYSDIYTFTVIPEPHVYPNPFRTNEANAVVFTDVPTGIDLYLMTVSGREVRTWTNTTGADITWDGTNDAGHPVGSDTYLWFISGTDIGGKIVLIR